MPSVLINADDLGLHPDIDRGILDCIEMGVVQSASFSPQGRNLDWKRLDDLAHAGVRLGLHVTLVGEPWGTDGRIVQGWKDLVKAITLGGRCVRDAVAREIDWQVRQCVEHGIRLWHIDSHQHVHAFGGVWQPVLRVAHEQKIPRVRVPWCPSLGVIKKNIGGVALQSLSRRLGKRITKAGGTFLPILGVSNAGHNTVEIYQREFALARAAKAPDLELCVHPGINTPDLERRYHDWHFNWTGERDALLSSQFKDLLASSGYALAPFLPTGRDQQEPVIRASTSDT